MTEDEFWEIIEQARLKAAGKSQFDHAQALIDEVARLSIEEIMAYYVIHERMMYRAYDPLLWNAAVVMAGGLYSEDGFSDFRSWLIAQGKAIYEAALVEPETLVDQVEIGLNAHDEDFNYMACRAYEKKTGGKEDFYDHAPDTIHLRDPWSRDRQFLSDEEAKERFPRLYAKFWNQWEEWRGSKANPDETDSSERKQNDDQ